MGCAENEAVSEDPPQDHERAFEERLPLHVLPESVGKSDEDNSCQTSKERGLPSGAARICERERADHNDVQGEEYNGDQYEGGASSSGF